MKGSGGSSRGTLNRNLKEDGMRHASMIGFLALVATGGCSKGAPATAAGLMGNVTRAPHVAPDPPRTGAAALPEKLEMTDISRSIRGNLTAVKVCYLREQRKNPRSGKAIVTFDINADGKVGDITVNAPSFQGSDLPGCVSDQVKRIAFPRFQKGPQTVSYPFVFVGS